MTNTTTFYMGFFKYEDSTIWQKTNLHHKKSELEQYLNNIQYINKATIVIKDIVLPNL